jgi:RNA polymerase sigma-70 factor (ECF subfamily)
LGWLGACLSHNLTDEIRKLRTGQRNVSREQSLEQALEQSSVRLEAWLVAEQSSPSVQAMRHEKELRVAAALAVLPELQRSIVVLRYWHRWQLAQIAEHLGRTLGSVAGLLHRAEKQLGQLLQDLSGEE